MIYTGIGSRQTPSEVLQLFERIATLHGEVKYTLRSGHAPGADQAFERAARKVGGPMEIYLPWASFEGGCEDAALTAPTEEAMAIAAFYHPAWGRLSHGAKKLMGRNTHQVLGADCETPANFILCWTPPRGGTTQALRIAREAGIPVVNLFKP